MLECTFLVMRNDYIILKIFLIERLVCFIKKILNLVHSLKIVKCFPQTGIMFLTTAVAVNEFFLKKMYERCT